MFIKILKSVFCILACIMLCIKVIGCGKEEAEQKAQTEQPSEQPNQWKTQGFAISENEEKEEELNIRQYMLWERDAALNADEGKNIYFVDSGSFGELIWRLNKITEKGERSEWVLEIYDAFTGESTVKKFSYEKLGLESSDGRLMHMDMIDRDHYVFQWVEAERYEEGHWGRWTADRMIYTDLAGELYSVDLWPVYLEAGLVSEGKGDHLRSSLRPERKNDSGIQGGAVSDRDEGPAYPGGRFNFSCLG